MAVTDIEVDVTAQQLEAAAKAKQWTKEEIAELIYPAGSVIIRLTSRTSAQLKAETNLPNSFWEGTGTTTTGNGRELYFYTRIG